MFSGSTAQSCNTKYFQNNFYHLGENSAPAITFLPDNSLILSSTYNQVQVSLIRISGTGDTIWSKLYDGHTPIGGNPLIKTITDVDGTLFNVCDSKRLMWTDLSGNLLSSVAITGLNLFRFYDAGVMPNGDKILLFQSGISGRPGALIMRTNKDASTVIWSKFVGGTGINFFSEITNIVINGNQITFGGSWNYTGIPDVSIFLGILNADNGSWVKTAIYDAPLTYSVSKKLYKTGDGYILFGYAGFDNANTGGTCYLRINADLQVTASKRIAESPGSYEGLWPIVPQADGSFYGTYGGMYDLSLFQINNQDMVTWMKKQPNNLSYPFDLGQNGDGLFVTGFQPYDNTGSGWVEVNFFLSKSDLNGDLPVCPSVPKNDIQLTDIVFSGSPVSVPMQDYPVGLQISATTVSDHPMDFRFLCQAADPCTSIKLLGDSGICNSGSVLFTGRRNDACTSMVQWKLSSTQGYHMDIKNDSTVSLQFFNSGKYLLTGSLNNCTKDSMWLYVSLGAGVSLGPDTTICSEPIVLHAGAVYKDYLWQDGSTDSVLNAGSPGEYRISVTDYCKNTYRDTVQVLANHFSLALPDEIQKCNSDTAIIQLPAGFSNYQVDPSPGTMLDNNTLYLLSQTEHLFIVSGDKWPGCTIKDSFSVKIKSSPVVDLGSDTSLCEGTEKLLNALNAGAVYTWQDGSANPEFIVKSPGVYAVTVNMNGCVTHDSISIAYQQIPQIEIDNEVRLCKGKQMTLEPSVQNADEIIWQDGSATSTYMVKDTGYYSIQAKNNCGIATKNIHVLGAVCNIHMPAAFSPDRNGINDRFEVKYPFPVHSFSLSVYNRWGQRVFETHDMSQGWNGKLKGEDAPVGGYAWFISVQYTDNVSENLHGTVLLLR